MSRKLWDAAREHSSVVAVVGQEHLPGIKRYWAQPIEVNI
jgi:pheromone shutdown protein TraB